MIDSTEHHGLDVKISVEAQEIPRRTDNIPTW